MCGTGAVQAAVVLNWAGVVLGGQARALYKNNVGPLCYDDLRSTQALAWSDMAS